MSMKFCLTALGELRYGCYAEDASKKAPICDVPILLHRFRLGLVGFSVVHCALARSGPGLLFRNECCRTTLEACS